MPKCEECNVKDCQVCQPICDLCDGDGWVYKRIDVDAEKRIPCECGLGDPD